MGGGECGVGSERWQWMVRGAKNVGTGVWEAVRNVRVGVQIGWGWWAGKGSHHNTPATYPHALPWAPHTAWGAAAAALVGGGPRRALVRVPQLRRRLAQGRLHSLGHGHGCRARAQARGRPPVPRPAQGGIKAQGGKARASGDSRVCSPLPLPRHTHTRPATQLTHQHMFTQPTHTPPHPPPSIPIHQTAQG